MPKIVVFDWGDTIEWVKGVNNVYYVTPRYLDKFKKEFYNEEAQYE